jgi:predicted TIM-barrel fold metal-dependent hydrolase
MREGLRVLDADAHVVEPAEAFGPAWLTGQSPMDLPPATPFVMCGDNAKVADQLEHGFDAASYLRAMDVEGIDAAVLYPSLGLFVPYQPELSPEQSAAGCRAYNEWIASYCDVAPNRLAAVGLVPLADPAMAAEVGKECGAAGLVGVLARPNFLYGRNLGDPAYDPLLDALGEAGLVLAVHEGLGLRGPYVGDRFAGRFALAHACSHPMEQMAALASLVFDGALERHPELRVAFLESGTGWLRWWLARLDEHAEWMAATEYAGHSSSPSEYFARQCVISSDPEDPFVAETVAAVGAGHVVWASDFPHPDALYPDAAKSFIAESGLSADDLAAVLWDTPVRFYGLAERFQ